MRVLTKVDVRSKDEAGGAGVNNGRRLGAVRVPAKRYRRHPHNIIALNVKEATRDSRGKSLERNKTLSTIGVYWILPSY